MKRRRHFLLGILISIMLAAPLAYAVEADNILGDWQRDGSDNAVEAQINIFKCDEMYCGKIIGLADPEMLDKNNKDESKQARKVMGVDLFWNLQYKDDGIYNKGTIYSLKRGKTFTVKMQTKSADEIEVSGCKGFLCGGEHIWNRIK